MSSSKLSRGKLLLFSVIPAAVLLVLLVGTELLIRVLHPEDDLALVREVRYDGIDWYETNRSALRLYFPPGTPAVPEFKTSLFRRQKVTGALRIFCLGESSMFGTPYDMNANIPGIVRKQLRRLMPGREVEVVNWGASAINSNVVRDLAPAIAAVPARCRLRVPRPQRALRAGRRRRLLDREAVPGDHRVEIWPQEAPPLPGRPIVAPVAGSVTRGGGEPDEGGLRGSSCVFRFSRRPAGIRELRNESPGHCRGVHAGRHTGGPQRCDVEPDVPALRFRCGRAGRFDSPFALLCR